MYLFIAVNSNALTSCTVNSNIIITQSIPIYLLYLLHSQFQFTYCTVNSNVLTYCSQFQCTYFLRSQFQYTYYTVDSNILIILIAQSIPIYLLHSQFQCTYCTINSNVLIYCTVNSNLLITQSIPIYLLIAQSIPIVPIPSSYLLGICHNYCEFSLRGILLSKVCPGMWYFMTVDLHLFQNF